MHQRFKKEFEALELSFSEVEQAINCPKNYLSRFVNGTGTLPTKWEKPIDDFLAALKKNVEKITDPPPNLELLKPWVKQIEDYCKAIGKDPEGLIEDHKALAGFKRVTEASVSSGKVQIQDLSADLPKTNYTINTRSNWAEEYRKKKLGLKD